MLSEFQLIKGYFDRPTAHTTLGIGDDAALIHVSDGHTLAISTDMSLADTHFFANANPYDIGWKALAVNISDMAAMGANPKWATLAIALPDVNPAWLQAFSRGFFDCATQFNVDLIGGDTTRGPLNISITIMGEVPTGKALKRTQAQLGDDIWVSGELGNANLGLMHLQQKLTLDEKTLATCLAALHQPQPRVMLGCALTNIAHSCIDISDGVLADLSHILQASNITHSMGAALQLEDLPCSANSKMHLKETHMQHAILAGGDDYELCFTAAPHQRTAIGALAQQLSIKLTRIGQTNGTGKLTVTLENKALNLQSMGYQHF
ncbi:MAG: thiamine-phosphate kinase [Methylophilaceae bacterium]|nr:thiamine-phosphate kinase [Methylophilaceae bacterium]